MPSEETVNGNVSPKTEYEQVSMTIRHCSNLRFLIIPVFFGINGAMFLATQGDKSQITPPMYFGLFIFSFVLSGVFVFIECVLNLYLEKFIEVVKGIKKDSFWLSRIPTGNWVSTSISLLYLSAAVSWLALAVFKNLSP